MIEMRELRNWKTLFRMTDTRKGFYPDDIAGTFGVPVEEHLKESEVQQIDGYVSMGILTGKTGPEVGQSVGTD